MVWGLLFFVVNFIFLGSVTHLILQHDDIYMKERSEYDLREHDNLQKVLEQDKLVKNADILLSRLEIVKRHIVDDAPLLSSEGEEDVVNEAFENDCLESGLLSDFDFSILPALEKNFEGYSQFEQYMCLGQSLTDVPLCSIYTKTFYMGDYRHIPGIFSINENSGSPAYALLPFIPTDDIALFGHCMHEYLEKDSSNWHAFYAASFYWRLIGNDGAALECLLRSLFYAQNDIDIIDGPLVSLANLLSNAGHDSDAALVMEHSAISSYLRQLKLWSAGNLYTMAEQYKLSLDLYNATLQLGPFPLADGRLQTLQCYRSVIRRMENQNNVLRKTLQKLQQRHQLETEYIGVQERMFSNLVNTSLPSHVIKQVESTEEAVINTHKLVLEQQEIQNTLSPNKYKDVSSSRRPDPFRAGKTGGGGGKKDVKWIRSTRLRLERLVNHIRGQLFEEEELPVYYDCADDHCQIEVDEKGARSNGNALSRQPNEESRDGDTLPQDEAFMLYANVFPTSKKQATKQMKVRKNDIGNAEGCEMVSEEGFSWYRLKCKVLNKKSESVVNKDVRISLRETDSQSASIELITDGNPETILPHVHKLLSLDSEVRQKLHTSRALRETSDTSSESDTCHGGSSCGTSGIHGNAGYHGEISRPGASSLNEERLMSLVTEHLATDDIFRTMREIRRKNIRPVVKHVEGSVEIKFKAKSWVLRLYKIDVSTERVVRVEKCDNYVPILAHADPYIPLMTPLKPFKSSLERIVKLKPSSPALSPDCTTYTDIDRCFLCYDDLIGVNQRKHDTRHILEDFPLQELISVFGDVAGLGAALDTALKEEPNNWLLYHVAAIYHRTFTFDLGPAIQCTRRALAMAGLKHRPIPLLTLANLLHQGRRVTDAQVIVMELLAIEPGMYLNHVLSAALQLDIGKADGQFRAAMDAVKLSHSPIPEHLLNSLLCYYRIHKDPFQPPHIQSVRSQRVSWNKLHPPFSRPHKAPMDGEIWRLEHHEGPSVDLTWVSR